MKFLLVTCLALSCLLSPPTRAASEPEQRELLRQQVVKLFRAESFAELDRLFDEAREHSSRTDSGIWRLWVLHQGILGAPPPASEAAAQEQVMRAKRWIAARPHSVAAPLVLAEVELRNARALRCGQCNVATASDRQVLANAALERAHTQLLASRKPSADDPQWYADTLALAQMQGWQPPQASRAMDEAVAHAPGYYTVWFNAVDLALEQPGSAAAIESLARRAMAATRQQEGNSLYARIWWYAAQMRYGSGLFTTAQVKWEDFDAGIRDVMQRYPDDWNRNNFANFACNAGKQARARELMAGHEPLPEAWDSEEVYLECIGPSFDT
jgi:hypothetical protein